jgi:CheY-like chemotaxis protein
MRAFEVRLRYAANVVVIGQLAVEPTERQRNDLLLMDVQMTELDGLEASRRVTARWRVAERPTSSR